MAAAAMSTNMRMLSKRLYIHGNNALKKIIRRNLSQAQPEPSAPPPLIGNQGWQLWSAVCLERPPVITQPINGLEKAYLAVQEQVEHENSYLSEHEMQHRNDLLQAELSRSSDVTEADTDAVKQTAHDLEDIWDADFQAFTPADRITDADRKNDQKSLKRKLDRKLVLTVKQKLGDNSVWTLPLGYCIQGETLRQTAERVLKSHAGPGVKASFLGNAPCGFHKYKYSTDIQSERNSIGVKIFVFKAKWLGGEFQLGNNTEDFLWLTKDELEEYLNTDYCKTIKDFVIDM